MTLRGSALPLPARKAKVLGSLTACTQLCLRHVVRRNIEKNESKRKVRHGAHS